ncbi:MAG: N-6 DNA methylase [Candidatus Parvarchaeota archaeon]
MTLPKIIERTLYEPIAEYLRANGFEDVITEARAGERDFSDLTFTIHNELFVVEVKVTKPTTTLSLGAMAQAARYARKYNTRNYIVLIFPETYKNQPITNRDLLIKLALNEKIPCLIFSDYWTESLNETPANLFTNLKNLVESEKHKIAFETVVEQIKRFVLDLNSIVYQVKNEELVSEVVEKLELFTAIGDVKDKEQAKKQITNLSSYLLFNQLMFYHIYQKLSGNPKLKGLELQEINKVEDLQVYFDAITDIDYASIYRTDILRHIPNDKNIVEVLNQVIEAIKLLRAEYVTHDLAGRFFHDLIPFEVRKILAAFYTHPNSADLLTGLTINKWNETVIDPACGSGTLLVSSYQRKLRLYKEESGDKDLKRIHKLFLEREITGIDIMPFASHITTINLAMQNIEQKTDLVRIASMDSLELAPILKFEAFTSGEGIRILGFERSIQKSLLGAEITTNKKGSVSMNGKGTEFYLTPSDVVIMNPPFSDREKMPKEMRDKLNNNTTLNAICGGQVNLWGLFLAMANLLIKNGGKIGAVIPINFARGEASRQIRRFLLTNYTTKFIIKPLSDAAFSEGASFKDILYIAIKKKPEKTDYTGIVSIKVSIKSITQEQVSELVEELASCYETHKDKDTEQFEVKFVKTLEMLNYADNLMPLIGFTAYRNRDVIESFLKNIRERSSRLLMKIPSRIISEGFHASPAGLSELVFVTRPLDKARVERAFLILKEEGKKSVKVELKNGELSLNIPYSKLKPALRTLSAIKTFNPESVDYILMEQPEGFDAIMKLSKWKGSFNWLEHRRNVEEKESFVVVGRRFSPHSNNTHHFAFYSSKGIVAPDTFKILRFENSREAKIQTLMLNSSITIANILSYREQTTGEFTDIRESELTSFDIFNFKELSEEQKAKLETLFNDLKDKNFPPLFEQYAKNSMDRRLIDSTILEILGFRQKEIDELLDSLYAAIVEELQAKA